MSVADRMKALQIELPPAPKPLGTYVPAVRVGPLLYLSGTLPLEAGVPKFRGRIGAGLGIDDARVAARLATLNALAIAREYLGSLDFITRIVRLTVSLASTADFVAHAQVADAASELLANLFGPDKASTRMVYGVSSLPAGASVVVELILAVTEGGAP